jgi:hypothetical protein
MTTWGRKGFPTLLPPEWPTEWQEVVVLLSFAGDNKVASLSLLSYCSRAKGERGIPILNGNTFDFIILGLST